MGFQLSRIVFVGFCPEDETARARAECGRSQDGVFDELEESFDARDAARLVTRALCTKSARAAARLRAAVERLEAAAAEQLGGAALLLCESSAQVRIHCAPPCAPACTYNLHIGPCPCEPTCCYEPNQRFG